MHFLMLKRYFPSLWKYIRNFLCEGSLDLLQWHGWIFSKRSFYIALTICRVQWFRYRTSTFVYSCPHGGRNWNKENFWKRSLNIIYDININMPPSPTAVVLIWKKISFVLEALMLANWSDKLCLSDLHIWLKFQG